MAKRQPKWDPHWETEVPGKAVWKGKELPIEGVTIPPFTTGLVKFLHYTGILRAWVSLNPESLGWVARHVLAPLFRPFSLGSWYTLMILGKPGVLRDVQDVSTKDIMGIVWFLRKPGCISNTWVLSGPGDAHLIKMVSKKYGTDGVKEFDNKSGEEITQILKVLHSQAAGADRAWPGLKRKAYEAG
ncbi:MAG: hypothetical protein AB1603_05745, partial [Chloroflexota bacterium]